MRYRCAAACAGETSRPSSTTHRLRCAKRAWFQPDSLSAHVRLGRRRVGAIRTQRYLDQGPRSWHGHDLQLGDVRLQSAALRLAIRYRRHSLLDGANRLQLDGDVLPAEQYGDSCPGAQPHSGPAAEAPAVRPMERASAEQVLSLRLLS